MANKQLYVARHEVVVYFMSDVDHAARDAERAIREESRSFSEADEIEIATKDLYERDWEKYSLVYFAPNEMMLEQAFAAMPGKEKK